MSIIKKTIKKKKKRERERERDRKRVKLIYDFENV